MNRAKQAHCPEPLRAELLWRDTELAPAGAGYPGRPPRRRRKQSRSPTAQLGKPYQWGATGPVSYDCSWLMQAAWASARSPYPRDTYSQVAGLPSVPLSALQPGDLVFFDGDGHAAMYVGSGMIIDAPRTGLTVKRSACRHPGTPRPFDSAARP